MLAKRIDLLPIQRQYDALGKTEQLSMLNHFAFDSDFSGQFEWAKIAEVEGLSHAAGRT